MVQQKQIPQFLWQRLENNGLRIGDGVEVRPLRGQHRKFKIDRTKMNLVKKNSGDDFFSVDWESPEQAGMQSDFSFELVGGLSGQEEQGRYLLTSVQGTPFVQNGQLVYQSFLERGDRVQIGGDDIFFSSGEAAPIKRSSLDMWLSTDRHLVLIGETGTGKGHLVKSLHQNHYALHPLTHININAINPQLVESELFGHIKGAFTGAHREREGAFRAAKRGLLFLDEMDSLTMDMQVKLLVALESGKVRAVGSDRETPYQSRLILAFGQDPYQLMQKSLMRKDLYFRLKSLGEIRLPSLRNNPELIDNFCLEFSLEKSVVLSPSLIDFYRGLPWPGNYRQLRSHLEVKLIHRPGKRMVFDQQDELLIGQSSDLKCLEQEGSELTLKQIKRAYAEIIYLRCGSNHKMACEKLEITSLTLKALLSKKENAYSLSE